MKTPRILSAILALILFFSVGTAAAQQVDPALIQRAREMGISQDQIDAAMQQAQSQSQSQSQNQNQNQQQGQSGRTGQSGSSASGQSRTGLIGSDGREWPEGLRTASGTDLELLVLEQIIIDSLNKQRDSIRVFGQQIFSNKELSFVTNYNLPTPKNYVLAGGDEVVIEVWGDSEMSLRKTITTEGTIYLDGVGPIQLNGHTIEEAERTIRSRLASIMGGVGTDTQVKVSLGQIRSIRVNVLGEVLNPGTYTLPSLATLFNALYMAGGVSDIGSLRNIRVYRNNKEVAALDSYDYLIYGKTEANIRLEDNDMIIVPPYDAYVWIEGAIKREMIYEMRTGEPIERLIEYAGGFKGEAYTDNIQVKRKSGRLHQLFTVDQEDYPHFAMHDGDSVKVGEIVDLYENRLQITGAVWRPGEYQYSDKLNTLSQLIAKAENLIGNQFADRGQIKRLRRDFTYEIVPFNVREIVTGVSDIPLQPEDEIYIPTIADMTEEYYILVRGEVNKPDTVPFRYNMNIEDIILYSGGLKESASMANVEVSRRVKNPNSVEYSNRIAQTFNFPITENLAVSPEGAGFVLQPFDEVYVRRSPAYMPQQRVTIQGEILFDGDYAFSRSGERLSEVIQKAGGVTPEAYIRGASLTRKLTEDEMAKVETMMAIANSSYGRDSLSLESMAIQDDYSVGIDLQRALQNPGGPDDIVLRDGDVIYIPKLNNTVKISGAVLSNNTVTFDGTNIRDYIDQAGGYNDNARHRPFIVYMNGKIASTRRGFLHRRYPKVEPGCEIIVPEKAIRQNRVGLSEIIGMTSSTASLAAIISTLIK